MFGESKLGTLVIWEYMLLLWETKFGRFIPARFISFCIIGGTGVINHIFILYILKNLNLKFIVAQSIATFSAMTETFFE